MKELSIEEKAQRYDKALKKARLVLQERGDEPDCASMLANLFPELAESEDEKIRKELINFCKIAATGQSSILIEDANQFNRWAAWLEKQGEHAKFRDSIQIGDKVTRNGDGVLVNLSQLKRVAKPVEPMIVGQEPLYDYTNANICQKDFAEQKPAWSEEDEKMFGYLEDIVNFCYCNQYVVNVQTCNKVRQLVFRLKSLCFQSGWGKDDITRINEIIETLNIVQANRVHTQRMHYNKATIDKNIDWLKSLKDRVRPQSTWKPSDEQMNNK